MTRTTPHTAALILSTSAVAFAALLFSSVHASAHDALPTAAKPNGWMYPHACCSGYDCRQVPADDVVEGPSGYVIRPTGELVPMSSPKVKYSPDGEFHWCSVAGADDGKTICLFVPPRSF